jgi:hypothetical protein
MDKEKSLKVLALVTEDMENDAKEFDGQPFTGKTVGTYFGNHGAAIVALSKVIEALVKQIPEPGPLVGCGDGETRIVR